MKKTILSVISICVFAIFSTGQLEFTFSNTTTVINNTTEIREVFTTDHISLSINVKNLGTSTQPFYVTRKIIVLPSAEWEDQVCWGSGSVGGTCVDTSSTNPLFNLNYPVALSPDESGLLYVTVFPSPLSGAPARYRYYAGTQGNLYMDSVDLLINSTLAIKEIKKDITLSVSPNPATEKVTIKVNNFDKGSLKIVDVLGNVVLNESFEGTKYLNVEDFKNGVYFIMISGDGISTINRKLVVRH